jgi:type II restriction/modification system DNA methylase subunit YeeA
MFLASIFCYNPQRIMSSIQSPQEFFAKWRISTLKESSASQEHFIDLCRLVGHPTPAEADPTGHEFTFEAGATKQGGGEGWADVWKKGYFAWEYKGKHKDLDEAYRQLLQYREFLLNPPLLVVSDMDRILVHTNFNNTVKRIVTIALDDLLKPEGMATLRAVFFDPDSFRAPQTTEQVTQAAAADFAHLADLLRKYGADPQEAAHFLIRLLFCLFAEDIGLLPKHLFTDLVRNTRTQPDAFRDQLGQLFKAMASGGWFGSNKIRYFDGRLFDDDSVLELDSDGLDILARVCALDWSNIEPSILGTLFERSLDPDKRSQIGAHYTGKEDILLIVEPVLMAPLRRRWQEVRERALEVAKSRDAVSSKATRTKFNKELTGLLMGFASELAQIRVLDPACGSGNFLYVALKQLLDLEKEIVTLASTLDLSRFFPSVSPAQLHGVEVNPYAHELAQATIWIGYIQWLHDNGFGVPQEPILKPIETVLWMDAVLSDKRGQISEPMWPETDCIIGNPPFLGGKRLRSRLGDTYVDNLFALYEGRVPHEADLVCYWFEKARAMIAEGKAKRAGLLATNSIRQQQNRAVLKHIKETGGMFMAWSDRPWVLDGAAVRVSMVGFDDGTEKSRILDGKPVEAINSDLTGTLDFTSAQRLPQNAGVAFMGSTKVGPFVIDAKAARRMLAEQGNPNGRPNSDVLRPWVNGPEILRRPRGMWIIDFGVDTPEDVASLYEAPFERILKRVKPMREKNKRKSYRDRWWIHGEPRRAMRQALQHLERCIVTVIVSKHRIFTWVPTFALVDHQLFVFARDDDYFLGVLHSKVHELWSLKKKSTLEDRSLYTSDSCFDTFPFPWPPGHASQDEPRVQQIAAAAHELVEMRDAWLNPPGLSDAELKKRTLTNLYNKRPTWLDLAHRRLDDAVLDAYGWPHNLSDEQILERLLALNLERSAA